MAEVPSRDPWSALKGWTSARIGLGRSGCSSPTRATLEFSMDQARARDAIHTPFDVDCCVQQFQEAGFATKHIWSQARTRAEYLRRPDLGRRLDPVCLPHLTLNVPPPQQLLTIVVADGLSSVAPTLHALPLLRLLRRQLRGWALDTVFVATQARVALGDGIGEGRGCEATLMLIGERPGLRSLDSLGAYLTYRPRSGCTDADRNCVSNIRPGGLGFHAACTKLLHLLEGARRLGSSGVALKDESHDPDPSPRAANLPPHPHEEIL
jgi:ethanolamine ammonia-lyase small subunit